MPGPNRPQISFRRLLDQVRAVPGVVAAGGTNRLPLAAGVEPSGDVVTTEENPSGRSLRGDSRAVTPDYFQAMGMRLLSGRGFTEADTDESEPVVIVDETAARLYWPGRDSLGRRMAMINTRFPTPTPHWMRVVGIVANVRHARLDTPPRPQFYLPYFRGEWRNAFLVVRVQGDPAALGSTLRNQISAVDRNAVVTDVRPMVALLTASTSQPRFRAQVLASFSLLALLLAVAGIYGVMLCVVEQRTPEIGMRMALGARATDIFAMVLGRGAALSVTGLAIGIGAALLLQRLIASLLFETSPTDPIVLAQVGVLLLVAALAACWAPSRRAARVDPLVALRHEN
jgi:predicted permease